MDIEKYKKKIRAAVLKYAEYNIKYFDAPIPIVTLIKKYFFKKEYEKLSPWKKERV